MVKRRLTLLRHAKSSWDDETLDDFDRRLNARGQRDAPVMGRRLLARGARPTLILTSPAVRARKTAQIVARELGYPREFLQREPELYLATPDRILEVVAQQDDSFRDILVVGHNPGLTELANRLMDGSLDNLPTCGVMVFGFDLPGWADLPGQRGELLWFDYPRRVAD